MIKKILLAGYFGYGNFGDELLVEIFKKRMPENFKIDTAQKMAKQPLMTLSKILKNDAFVFPGGSIFQDETSLKSVFFYILTIFFALISGKKVFLLDQGFEITNKFVLKVLKIALKKVKMLSVRDHVSFNILKSIGINAFLSADPVFSLELPDLENISPKAVGIIPRGNFLLLKEPLKEIQQNFSDLPLKIAIFSEKDRPLAEKIKKLLSLQTDIKKISKLEDLIDFFKQTGLLLCAPYHAVVVAYICGINFRPLIYSKKVESFLKYVEGKNRKKVCLEYKNLNCLNFNFFLNLLRGVENANFNKS
ncbi:MAG: polysaccharide pyruvyl transferase family protein [Elusimicrobia bacterium]|nr:polysaccharide pyruvyl transferase family protein [Elusimicrobiota bacterium]